LLLVCCLLAGPASAQTTVNLDVFNLDFGNATTGTHIDPTIHVGDTVDWHWVAGTHSVTTVSGSTDPFNSGDHSPTFSFSHTFNTTGTFWYYCDIHGFDLGNGTATGMSGRVVVMPVPEPTAVLAFAGIVGGGVVGIRRRGWIGRRVVRPFTRPDHRPGFTLLEVLVVLAVMSLLAGLLLSAVHKVRESAGYTACRNNLRQIGLAVNMHELQYGYYPGIGTEPNQTSALVPLLPFLEQDGLRQSMAPDKPLFLTIWDYVRTNPYQAAAAGTVVRTFLCPSDSVVPVTTGFDTTPVAGTNYVANGGSGTGTYYDFRYPTDGVFWYGSKLRRADITDGTSSTMFFAEALRGEGPDSYELTADPRRHWMSMICSTMPSPDRPGTDPPLSNAICRQVVFGMTMRGDRNVSWIGGPGHRTLFNTYYMPNDPMMDCGTFGLGWFKATSGHPGGANMVLGDGSVHFIKNHIDLDTWRALSTRSDREVIGSYCGCH
jgi:prepilin-type N-terminal cleavage/methylation domain-containing protein/prepilin-type processing-associated H-X9-DG protein